MWIYVNRYMSSDPDRDGHFRLLFTGEGGKKIVDAELSPDDFAKFVTGIGVETSNKAE